MFGSTRRTLVVLLVVLVLLVVELQVGAGRRHQRHRRRHLSEDDLSSCPDRCVCRPVGDIPCDWCAHTTDADGQDGRVSCEGCGYGTVKQVRAWTGMELYSL